MREVAFVINSMAIWRFEALAQIGRFNELLAIDHIDTDYCLRARHRRTEGVGPWSLRVCARDR
jgi:GT2 family glycosyltransferase